MFQLSWRQRKNIEAGLELVFTGFVMWFVSHWSVLWALVLGVTVFLVFRAINPALQYSP